VLPLARHAFGLISALHYGLSNQDSKTCPGSKRNARGVSKKLCRV
jgi:hypothetical protein